MKIAWLLGIAAVFCLLLLGLGYHGKIKKRIALLGSCLGIVLGSWLLLLAVLPGETFYGPVLAAGHTDKKVVALTFDDGPYPPYTAEILDILKKKNVPATFFVVGENALAQPELVLRIKADGHLIGTHTQHHKDLLRLDKQEMRSEMTMGIESIRKITGESTQFIRPPHGFKDYEVIEQAESLGLKVVNWDIIPRDWTNPGTEKIVSRVVENVKPGSVVLLHDGDSPANSGSREQTVQALPMIIDQLRAEGYSFVTIAELQAK
ncbi:MAG: polysaccharide deacetylase family protein [Acidaminococcaceae bacterium]